MAASPTHTWGICKHEGSGSDLSWKPVCSWDGQTVDCSFCVRSPLHRTLDGRHSARLACLGNGWRVDVREKGPDTPEWKVLCVVPSWTQGYSVAVVTKHYTECPAFSLGCGTVDLLHAVIRICSIQGIRSFKSRRCTDSLIGDTAVSPGSESRLWWTEEAACVHRGLANGAHRRLRLWVSSVMSIMFSVWRGFRGSLDGGEET